MSPAADEFFTRLYDELRVLAHQQLSRGRPGDTLNTTSLVHELYLKFRRGSGLAWENEQHFLATAARAMRQLIVDQARTHAAVAHGGRVHFVTADPEQVGVEARIAELVALDEALHRLERLSPRLCRVVEYVHILGLSVAEAAAAMECSPRTIKRDLSKARALLQTTLTEQPSPGVASSG